MKTNPPTKVYSNKRFLLGLLVVAFLQFSGVVVHAKNPVVHAILFYSPTCGHCHQVLSQDLPPLVDKYQDQLYILVVNTSTPDGQILFQGAIDYFHIPGERQGVPMLLVGDVVLVGSFEIPDQFPDIVTAGLAGGGIDWPDLPQLLAILIDQNLIAAENPNNPLEKKSEDEIVVQPPASAPDNLELALENIETMTVLEKFSQDKAGNSLSVLVLVGMTLVVGGVGTSIVPSPNNVKKWPLWVAPILITVGLGIAAYMGFVEVTKTEAVCGPVGDCNTVQQSPYAYLFGLIPIGVLGVLGYFAIILAWAVGNYGPAKWRKQGTVVLFGLTLFGTIFSIYLTFLEPFIIGASCAWCLSSAVVMTLLLIYSRGYTFASEDL